MVFDWPRSILSIEPVVPVSIVAGCVGWNYPMLALKMVSPQDTPHALRAHRLGLINQTPTL
jgi:hypothetical protein